MSTPKAIPELSLDTQVLERLLLTVEIGQVITYDTLSAAIGRDVQHDARHILRSAIRRVRRDPHRMLFEAVVDVGVKRMDDVGKVTTSEFHGRKGARQYKIASEKAGLVDNFDALPNDVKVRHNVLLAQAGMMKHVMSRASVKRLAEAISEPKKEMPLRQCLKAMAPLI